MEILWITQMDSDGDNDSEIITLDVKEGTWGRLLNMPIKLQRETWQPYDVIITLKTGDDDLAGDDPIVISPSKADWLLGDFFKLPKRAYKLLKQPKETES